MSTRVPWSVLAAMALMSGPLLAQERRPLLGKVVDADGKPLPNATVQLAHVPRGGEAEVAADHMQVTTDERGRFRADVWSCTEYRLWAVGTADAAGSCLASQIAQANANQVVELRAAKPFAKRHVIVRGAGTWTELAPLRLRVVPSGVELPDMTFPIGADERVELPPLPDAFVTFEVLDKNDAVVLAQCIRTDGDWQLGLPRLRPLAMRVVDDRGAPVAGAEIRSRCTPPGQEPGLLAASRWRTHTRLLGATDADGRLTSSVPYERDPFTEDAGQILLLLAHKAGHTAAVSGFASCQFHDGQRVTDAEVLAAKELRFTLRPSGPMQLTIASGQKPVTGVRSTVHTFLSIPTSDRTVLNCDLDWRGAADAEGRIEVASPPPTCTRTVVTLAADAAAVGLPAELRKELPLHPVVLRRLPRPPAEPLRIDLNTFVTLRIAVLDENKAPARDAQLLLIEQDAQGHDEWTPQFVPNGTGQLTLLVQPGTWALFARNETGYAFRTFDAAAEPDLTMQLEPVRVLRGKVVDAAGKPVAGAELAGITSAWLGPAHDDVDRRLLGIAQSDCWSRTQRVRTAADGSFSCSLLLLPGMGFKGTFRVAGKRSAEFTMKPDDEPVTVTIE
jgi:protocatechuate 3,4-dioxygenase beta subunit